MLTLPDWVNGGTSALPPKADFRRHKWHVRFVPEADMRRTRCVRLRSDQLHNQTAIGNVIPKRIDRPQITAGRPLSWAGVPLTL